jgi:hypothetical protein
VTDTSLPASEPVEWTATVNGSTATTHTRHWFDARRDLAKLLGCRTEDVDPRQVVRVAAKANGAGRRGSRG